MDNTANCFRPLPQYLKDTRLRALSMDYTWAFKGILHPDIGLHLWTVMVHRGLRQTPRDPNAQRRKVLKLRPSQENFVL